MIKSQLKSTINFMKVVRKIVPPLLILVWIYPTYIAVMFLVLALRFQDWNWIERYGHEMGFVSYFNIIVSMGVAVILPIISVLVSKKLKSVIADMEKELNGT